MDDKTEKTKNTLSVDWELTDDFYQANQLKPSLSIEDFIEPEDSASVAFSNNLTEVEQAAEDVKKVLSFMKQGKTTKEIADSLTLEESYVHNIQMCIQSFPEDNPIAVAHLVLMG